MVVNKSHNKYINQLFKKLSPSVLIVFAIGLFYILSMSFIDHTSNSFNRIVLFLAVAKTGLIGYVALIKVSKLMDKCHSLNNLIWTFSTIILITLFSFATDYTCLFQSNSASFIGAINNSNTYIYNLFQFFYFSVATFSTVGFGDITPSSDVAKIVVMLEIFLSFLIIVFSLTNIKKAQL